MKNEFQPSPGDAEMESRLWEYIDGIASAEESTVISKLITDQREWKEKYEELMTVNDLMLSAELEHPSMRFAKNVMEEIGRLQISPAAGTYINKRVIWGIAGFFIASIVAFLIYSVGLIDWGSSTPVDPRYSIDIKQPDYARYFNSTYTSVFLMINIILGLFLLDRFLANKRKKFREEL
ncbi:MAG: hypothetical protein ABWZ25_03225 [Chitinophagaceae bacterium]